MFKRVVVEVPIADHDLIVAEQRRREDLHQPREQCSVKAVVLDMIREWVPPQQAVAPKRKEKG